MHKLKLRLMLVFALLIVMQIIISLVCVKLLQSANSALERDGRVFTRIEGFLQGTDEFINSHDATFNQLQGTLDHTTEDYRQTVQDLDAIASKDLPLIVFVADVDYALTDINSAERGLLLSLTTKNIGKGSQENIRAEQKKQIQESLGVIRDGLSEYHRHIGQAPQLQKIVQEFQPAFAAWLDNHNQFMAHIGELEKLQSEMFRAGPRFESAARAAYNTVFITGRDTRERCQNLLSDMHDLVHEGITKAADTRVKQQLESYEKAKANAALANKVHQESSALASNLKAVQGETANAIHDSHTALAAFNRNLYYLLFFLLLAIVISVVVGWIMVGRISEPISDLTSRISRLSLGELGENVPERHLRRQDEIGLFAQAVQDLITSTHSEIHLLNGMANGDYTLKVALRSPQDQLGHSIRSMLDTTNHALGQVNGAVQQVADNAGSVSSASRALSAGAVKSAAALEEISASIAMVDEQARSNAERAGQASALATGSSQAALKGYEAVKEMTQAMEDIQAAGEKISSVAKLIDNIAFQTNLLSLNASIEAARAGQHGRGFAVVANEVRNLARRSAKAVGETTEMIGVMAARVAGGVEMAERTNAGLRDIVDSTEQVAKVFDDIAVGSRSQSDAVKAVAQSLHEIDDVTRHNAASAEETASSAEAMLGQTSSLAEMVKRFKLDAEVYRDVRGQRNGMVGAGGGRGSGKKNGGVKLLTEKREGKGGGKALPPPLRMDY